MHALVDQELSFPTLTEMRKQQARWAAIPIKQRLKLVRDFRHVLVARSESLAIAAAEISRRPVAEKLVSEILPLTDACRWLERRASRVLATRGFGSWGRPLWLHGASFEVQRMPFGIVLIIAPANYPIFLSGVQALHALAAGNVVLLKPAPGTASLVRKLAETARFAGWEPHLLNVLPESIEAVHRAIAQGVDKVIFTGASENGRQILSELAKSNTPAVMELSGEDVVLVLADADLPMVVRALLFGTRWNGGATCMAPHRVIVVGQLASEVRARIFQEGVTDLPVEEVATEQDALRRLEAHPFALGVSIFSRDARRAQRLGGQISSGFVVINDLIVPTVDPRMPFGGVKASGFGVTRGEEGLLEMTFPQVVAVRHNRIRAHFDELRPEDTKLFSSYIRVAHGRGLARVRAMRDLIASLLARPRLAWRSP
jgi:acyl-CoA reductase-like NAD-dependent aldehyde dehydrogenase